MINPEVPSPSEEEINPDKKESIEDIEKRLLVRDVPEGYRELIEKVQIIELQEEYARNLEVRIDSNEDLEKFLHSKFEDKSILDLGCGGDAWYMWNLSKTLGAKEYIGVHLNPGTGAGRHKIGDKNRKLGIDYAAMARKVDDEALRTEGSTANDQPTETKPESKSKFFDPKILNIDPILIKSDMLNAVSRMPDSLVGAIIVSGIEYMSCKKDSEYMQALSRECERILQDDGVVIQYHGDFATKGLFIKARNFSPDQPSVKEVILEKTPESQTGLNES